MSNVAKFAALSAAISGTTDVVAKLTAAVKGMGATVSTEFPKMQAEMSATGTTITKVAQGMKDVAGEWQQHQLDMLSKLKEMVIPFEGADAGSQFSFDKIIDDQIDKVKSGKETAQEAIQELQRQFGSVYGTIQKQYFGSQDPGAQQFLLEIEQFINSGNLNLG